MMSKKQAFHFGEAVVFMMFSFLLICNVNTFSQGGADKRKQEIQERIRKLEEEKIKAAQKMQAQQEENKPKGDKLGEVIDRYEKLLLGCKTKKSARCSDVYATLASLYYDEAKDKYVAARNKYEEDMKRWEKTGSGPEPVNPLPDYSKSLEMYRSLIAEYPDYPKIDEAYYQIGSIYLVGGDIDKSKAAFQDLINKMPNSVRASAAHFRLGDFAYLDHDFSTALKHLEAVKQEMVNLDIIEMTQWRKADMHYNMGDFDQALELFFGYIENCDKGLFKKCEFHQEALEFMGITFSDMGNGGEAAEKFFRKVGDRPYEDYVFYTIGMKNRVHGQYDDAIKSLQYALNKFPYYKDAPLAQQMLVECYLVKKEYDKANDARQKLVDSYGAGSQWYSKNASQKAIIEKADENVKDALGSIALFYHAKAQQSKDRSQYEKALKRYEEFFSRFPDDKWRIYEYKYNVAEIYNTLGDCEKSSQYYDFVAMEDLTKYPEYKSAIDTLGFDQEEIEKMKKETKSGPKAISQEDAGYNAIVALDNCRKKAIAKAGANDEATVSLPETQKFLNYIGAFAKRFPQSQNSAEVLYLAGSVYYGAKDYKSAINQFQVVINTYPSSKMAEKALRMLANCYTSTGDYDLALSKYRELIAKIAPNTTDYQEAVDLAAGALYKKAESIKKSGNVTGAVDAYKAVASTFPTSKLADRAWFDAAASLEAINNFEQAAAIFEQIPDKFPKSTLRENAFVRAAENYKKANKFELAASTYVKAASAITKADFAIASLSNASECYQKLEKFDEAGKVFQLIYERYATDPKTPQALYNAGLIFEKGKLYANALEVYNTLSQKFAQSEYAAEAFFSMGLCYEKMGQNDNMAAVFTDFAKRFSNDRFKQVQALVKAGDAYYKMNNVKDAESNYSMAITIQKEYGGKADIDMVSIAKACYMLGEIKYKAFTDIKLTGGNEKEVRARLDDKTKALLESGKPFAKAIEMGVEEWTIKATYMIGQGFVDMADAVAHQKLFGSTEQQIAAKITILSSLEKYYLKAQDYFVKNIDWAYEQNIKGEYVDKSTDMFMQMCFMKGSIFEQVGETFKSSPIPKGLEPEEKQAYQELLEEKDLEARDAAVPKYEEGIRAAAELGIVNSPWLDKIRERVRIIKPDSDVLNLTIQPRVAKATPTPSTTPATGKAGKKEKVPEVVQAPTGVRDEDYSRNMQRIRNIMNMEITSDEKIRQLSRIEIDAQRNIVFEEDKIKEIKAQLGQ